MFYSLDLLSLKGRRMNLIWLLGTQRLYRRESSVALTFTWQGQERADQEEEGGTSQRGSNGPMQGACQEVVSTIITIRHLAVQVPRSRQGEELLSSYVSHPCLRRVHQLESPVRGAAACHAEPSQFESRVREHASHWPASCANFYACH